MIHNMANETKSTPTKQVAKSNGGMSDVAAAMKRAKKSGTLSGLKHRDVQTVIGAMRPQIEQALPKHVTPERIVQMAVTMVTSNPKIAECSAESIVGAIMQSSILGFKPVASLGHCYFVPYGGHVQFQIGYRGWIELSRRSGQIKTLHAFVVRDGDEFKYSLGLYPDLKHVPAEENHDAEITHVYAVAHYADGGHNFVVLPRAEIERLRMRNPQQKGKPTGAWATDYAAMACAKAIKQLSKYMPLSDDMMNAAATDDSFITAESFTNDHSGVNPDAVTYDITPTDDDGNDS